jgi:DNA-binding response OmpR family regulator
MAVDARVTVSSTVPADVVAALRTEQFEIVEAHGDLAIVRSDELPASRPVLALSPPAGVIAAFAAGADDVVVIPADPREVAARAHAILRRTQRVEPPTELLRFADVALDDARHEVSRAGRPLALTLREFELLRYFMVNPCQLLSKPQILGAVWGVPDERHANIVETYVGYLRRKLGEPQLIRTVRQGGYVLSD